MDKQAFDRGMKISRDVLGDAHVDRSMAAADEINRPLQELITQYCWGEIWSRPGLDRKTRSTINLAMLAALNRPHELKLHIQGALRNGLSQAEIGSRVGVSQMQVSRLLARGLERMRAWEACA